MSDGFDGSRVIVAAEATTPSNAKLQPELGVSRPKSGDLACQLQVVAPLRWRKLQMPGENSFDLQWPHRDGPCPAAEAVGMAPAVRHHAEARAFAHLAPGIPLDENAFHPDVAVPPPKMNNHGFH